jgi:hypothetical protein
MGTTEQKPITFKEACSELGLTREDVLIIFYLTGKFNYGTIKRIAKSLNEGYSPDWERVKV